MSDKQGDDRTRISVQIPDEDFAVLQRIATIRRNSISDVVRDALVQFIAKFKSEKK